MKYYLIKANVTWKIFGISSPSMRTVSHIVRAPSEGDALVIFERYERKRLVPQDPQSVNFQYLEIADEIM
jgi:hypothetical protein